MRRAVVLLAALAFALPAAGCRRHRRAPLHARRGIAVKASQIVRDLSRGAFAKARAAFDEKMAKALPAIALEGAWATILDRAGELQAVESSREEAKDGARTVVVTTRHARARVEVRVVFDAKERVSGLWFSPAKVAWTAPPYAKPATFTERTIAIGEEPRLPATITLPNAPRPARAVVLVHGSGPNDRDETLGGLKPFADLALGLASRGVAVLRYEKRTRHAPSSLAAKGAFDLDDEVTRDARAAVSALAAMPEIDPKHVVVVGHSLGASMAPRIAKGTGTIAGLVLLAGATRSFEQLLVDQTRYLFAVDGTLDDAARTLKLEALRDELRRARSEGDPAELVEVAGSKAPRSYFRDLTSYRGEEVAKELALPMLILQGARDYQVTVEDFDGWKGALSGKPGVGFRLYPALNHAFVAGEGPSTPDEYAWPGHVAEGVIGDVAKFVDALP